MVGYTIRRILLGILVIIGVVALIFVISRLLPANPARAWAGVKASKEQVQALREEYHLDDPIHIQFFHYIDDLVHGNLGVSPVTHRPVSKDLQKYIPATVELVIVAMLVALSIGVPLGVLSAVKRGTVIDHFARIIALSGVSVPVFWSGLLFQLFFFFKLGWLPAVGRISSSVSNPPFLTGFYILDSLFSRDISALASSIQHLILPSLCLSFYAMAMLTRVVRTSVLETLQSDYVRTAYAKGLSNYLVLFKHVLRNSFSSALTVVGMTFVYALGGTVVVETVFAWPGVGRYAAGALSALDFPALMGFILLVGTTTTFVNLIVDLLYGVLDPRVRYH